LQPIVIWAKLRRKGGAVPGAHAPVMNEREFSPWQRLDGHRLVFLLDHSTRLERRLLEAWLHDTRADGRPAGEPDAEVVSLRDRRARFRPAAMNRIGELCAASPTPYFVPLRVLWIPSKGDRSARAHLAAFVAGDPRAPGSLKQRWIHRRDPSRARPMAAEGASLEALQERFQRSHQRPPADPAQLSEFVGRQAVLALERAEARIRGARYKVPRLVAEEMLDKPSLQSSLDALAAQTGRSPADARRYAGTCLAEMAAVHSTFYLDLMAEIGRYLYTRGFDPEIQVPAADVARIREMSRRRPLVFLMTHKSHLDGFLMVTMLHDMDLPPLHIFGGINMSFPGLGTLGRRSGTVFIRRSFADDPIYKLILRSYIDYLVEKRFPLLWALEGTRSRTGKLMPPRYGLLNYVVDSYVRSAAADVVLVPVAIMYDQVPEVSDYVAEAKGVTKRPESASWFMKYVSGLHNPFGRIHVRFGEGVSLAEEIGSQNGDGVPSKLDLQKIAFQLAVQANSVTPVTASAMITFILLAHGHRALTLGELVRELQSLLGFVRLLDLPTTADVDLASREVLETVLGELRHTGVITVFEDGIQPVYAVPTTAATAAAYYRNSCVHFFVPSAIAELALQHVAGLDGCEPLAAFRAEALRVRDLLKFEFFFDDKEAFLHSMESQLSQRAPEWRDHLASPHEIGELLESLDPLLAPGTLRPFVEAYWVLADALLREDPAQPLAPKPFLKRCVALGQQRVRQRRVASEESASRAYFEPALKLAENRGLLTGDAGELQAGRKRFAAELAGLVARIDRLALLAERRRTAQDPYAPGNEP
jgi:glycerol-3-phosphate O-acyltransferase